MLRPFSRFCVTLGAIPRSIIESLSYEEQVMKLFCYIKDKIDPSIKENREHIEAIEYWIEHADFQEEVNKKLDKMAESGVLAEIIAQYIQLNGVLAYNTVDEMKIAENLVEGSIARTLGFHNINDKGSSLYKIRKITNQDVVDESIIISLNNPTIIAELIKCGDVNIKQLGAYGDNIHDDTSIFKIGVSNFNTLHIPNGTYLISDSIEINSQTQLIGESMTNTILKSNTDEFVFRYLTDVHTGHYDIKSNILIKKLRCQCKNFLKVNDENYTLPQWEYQASVLHIIVDSVWLQGTYQNATDTNKNTNILPTFNEMKSYGIAFNYNNVFDSQIINSNIETFGIGIYLKGCDINKIEHNRIVVNGIHLYTDGIGTYGSQTIFSHNDVLANQRYGGIRINSTSGDLIEDNYFETYTDASNYIYAENEKELSIINNRITNPGKNGISVIHIAPALSDYILNNRTTDRNIDMNVEIDYSKTTLFINANSHRNNTICYYKNNSTNLILKDKLNVVTDNYNPLIISPYNLKYDNSRIEGSAYQIANPYVKNNDYNIYGFNNLNGTGNMSFSNALTYYGKPLKIRYYYISNETTTMYRVVSVDGTEIKRGSQQGLIADGKIHYFEDDLTEVNNNVGNIINFQLPTQASLLLLKIELF